MEFVNQFFKIKKLRCLHYVECAHLETSQEILSSMSWLFIAVSDLKKKKKVSLCSVSMEKRKSKSRLASVVSFRASDCWLSSWGLSTAPFLPPCLHLSIFNVSMAKSSRGNEERDKPHVPVSYTVLHISPFLCWFHFLSLSSLSPWIIHLYQTCSSPFCLDPSPQKSFRYNHLCCRLTPILNLPSSYSPSSLSPSSFLSCIFS